MSNLPSLKNFAEQDAILEMCVKRQTRAEGRIYKNAM